MSTFKTVLILVLLFISVYFIVRIMKISKQLRKTHEEATDLLNQR